MIQTKNQIGQKHNTKNPTKAKKSNKRFKQNTQQGHHLLLNHPKTLISNLILLSIFRTFQLQKATSPVFTGIQHHPEHTNIQISPARTAALPSDSNFKFFVGAWLKAKNADFIIRGAKKPSPTSTTIYLIRESSTTTCERILSYGWVFLLQVYEEDKHTPGQYNHLPYYRTDSKVSAACTPPDIDCSGFCAAAVAEDKLVKPFGPSVVSSFTSQHTFEIIKNSVTLDIQGAVSGFIDYSGPSIPNEIAQALVSGGPMTEIPESRVYLGNFIHSYQKHLFLDPPGDDIIFSESDFYNRIWYGGLFLKHLEKVKLRPETKLFQADSSHLPKSFCLSGYLGPLNPHKVSTEERIIFNTTIKITGTSSINIHYMLEKQSDNDFKLKLNILVNEVSKFTQYGQGTPLTFTQPFIFDFSYCFSVIKYRWSDLKTEFFLYFNGIYFRRKDTNPRVLDASVGLALQSINLHVQNTADVSFNWKCEGGPSPEDCQVLLLYLYDYREFNWGHSNYHSEDVQKLDTENDVFNTITNCQHAYGPVGSQICLQCKKNYDWIEGACVESKTVIKDCAQLQSVKTEVDGVPTQHCQRCWPTPNMWGIAPPACISEVAVCRGPDYNLHSSNRCDYCRNPAPNNCRCKAHQVSMPHPSITDANYCKCKVNNCKFILYSPIS